MILTFLARRFRCYPIRRKLLVNSLITSTVALVAVGALFIAIDRMQYRSDVIKELNSNAEMIGTNVAAPILFADPRSAQKTLDALRAVNRIAVAYVVQQNGKALAFYQRPGYSSRGVPSPVPAPGTYVARAEVAVSRTITLDRENIGTVYVRSDLPDFQNRLKRDMALMGLGLIGASLLALLVGSVLQRSISGPLVELASIARDVSVNNNYSVRARRQSEDEIGLLVDAFNRMLEQVDNRDRHLEEQVRVRTAELTQTNQDLIRACDRAEEAARLKSEFLANMSHEIRTPMNVILGMTQITLETQLNPQQRRHLTMVQSSAGSLLKIINDILDFSKIEAGKLDLEPIDFRLAELLPETMAALTQRAQDKGLDLQLKIEDGIPDVVVGDPMRLGQVLINLISNAIKFTSEGRIEVSAACEAESAEQVTVQFSVQDSGIGIPEEKRNLIFEAFAQADGSTTRRFGGTGLGLSISKRLVEMMDGRIWVDSRTGEGSAFHFTARFGVPAPQAPAALVPERADRPRAIIVDESSDVRCQLASMLEAWQIDSVTTADSASAMEIMKWSTRVERPFSFALLNLAASGCGRTLAGEMRKDGELAHLPIVALSDQAVSERDLERVGAVACISTPVSQSDLLNCVSDLLRPRSRAAAPPAAPANGAPRQRPLHILLAEDIQGNQEFMTALLTSRKHTLEIANNGIEAVEMFRTGKFDLILMDAQMPEMGGIEATLAIRELEIERHTHIPIIALTANAMKGDRERYLEAQMDAYIAKPVDIRDLLKIMAELTRKI